MATQTDPTPAIANPDIAFGKFSMPDRPTPTAPRASQKYGRSRMDRELKRAADERNRKAEHDYRANPPKSAQDVWICEFCEYEQIFGEKPNALIRQYEMKELKQREKERCRLMEKAKARSRDHNHAQHSYCDGHCDGQQ